MRILAVAACAALFLPSGFAQKKLTLNDLPPEAQKPVSAEFPAPATAAILKKVADGNLGMVELFVRGGTTLYEAAYTTKAGRKHKVLVTAGGAETKE